jgi:hypothetical protein
VGGGGSRSSSSKFEQALRANQTRLPAALSTALGLLPLELVIS